MFWPVQRENQKNLFPEKRTFNSSENKESFMNFWWFSLPFPQVWIQPGEENANKIRDLVSKNLLVVQKFSFL